MRASCLLCCLLTPTREPSATLMLEGVAVPVCRTELGFLPFLPISVALIRGSQADLRLGTLGIHGSVPGPTGSYFTGALAARRQAEKLVLLKLPTVQQLPRGLKSPHSA